MGDLASLAESIQRHGLLHPIVIKTDSTLVAGHRRLEAVQLLGWRDIPVTVIDVADLLSAERDENAERKDFTPTEAVAIGRLIEEHQKPLARARQLANLNHQPRPAVSAERGEVITTVSRAVGMGKTKYGQAKQIVAAAEADPAAFGDLPERMDETGNVQATHDELKRRQTGGPKPRHAVHRKSHYPKPNREMERAVHSLDGICICLEAIKPEELDANRIAEWCESLKKSAATINRVARAIRG